jgi:AraC family transcriptional regulator, regulatory protein of adaptative response / methylphosphotriester-DNA alkyltransferase methyltransferase
MARQSSPVARRRPAPIGEAIATIVAILTRGLHAQLVLDPIVAYGAKGFDMQRTSTIRLRASLLEEANEIVARDYASDLLLDDIARRVASSRRQLQRAYAEVGQTTFRAHLTRVRMDRAAELLSTRMFTVREVAHRVGYRQPAQFAKAFRRYRGIAPSDYRSGGNSASAPLEARAA